MMSVTDCVLFAVNTDSGSFKTYGCFPSTKKALDKLYTLIGLDGHPDVWPCGWEVMIYESCAHTFSHGSWWMLAQDGSDQLLPLGFDPFSDLPLEPLQELTEEDHPEHGQRMIIKTRHPSLEEMLTAKWEPFNSYDYLAFAGANEGSWKADAGDFLLIFTPGLSGGIARIEAHGVFDGEPVAYLSELSEWQTT